jgi:DNA-directed RNA polymerase specialized sigma subunit
VLKNWHFNKACILYSQDGGELKRKVEAVEKALTVLDDTTREVIKMRYFDKTDMEIVAAKLFLWRSAVYKRLDKAFQKMSYFLSSTG